MNDSQAAGTTTTDRMAVLLGAGTSADAGLSLTSDLAKAVIDEANADRRRNEAGATGDRIRALNAVYAGMVGYQGARGQSPLNAVNIETLISAVRLLAERDDHEVAPFVASWSPSLSNFSRHNISNMSAENLLQAMNRAQNPEINRPQDSRDVAEAVATLALSAVNPDLYQPFKDAEEFILETLVHLLGQPKDVSYLNPLIELSQEQSGGLDIITLNYDLTVETAARQLGVVFNRGVESWTPGERLYFPRCANSLNIIKLHGSLDWRSNVYTDVNLGPLLPRDVEVVAMDTQGGPAMRQRLPWIVVGDRDKLGTDGPTLELNFAARNALTCANHLLVVGYSFSDKHINAMIRDWLSGDKSRTICVLDRDWPILSERNHSTATFKTELVWEYGREQDRRGNSVKPRMRPIAGKAKDKLREAVNVRPGDISEEIISVRASRSNGLISFVTTWNGPDLERVQLFAEPVQTKSSTAEKTSLFTDLPPSKPQRMEKIYASPAMISGWKSGTQKHVYARDNGAESFLVRLHADSILGRQHIVVQVAVQEPKVSGT